MKEKQKGSVSDGSHLRAAAHTPQLPSWELVLAQLPCGQQTPAPTPTTSAGPAVPGVPPLLVSDPTCFSHTRHCLSRSRSSLPCFPRTGLLIAPDGNAKALQRFVKLLGSLSPPQRPPCHIQQCQTAYPWPWAALCSSRHWWTIYHILSPLQSHRAEPHMLLSVVKAQGLLTPRAQSEGSGCGAPKRKSHSKILHNIPGAMPSRCIFK